MSRSYESRRRSEHMRAPRPTETPATDACTVFRQQWEREDGQARTFDVLALDEPQALQMGAFRLTGKYHQDLSTWLFKNQRAIERFTSIVIAILTTETPEEDALREFVYLERNGGGSKRLAS